MQGMGHRVTRAVNGSGAGKRLRGGVSALWVGNRQSSGRKGARLRRANGGMGGCKKGRAARACHGDCSVEGGVTEVAQAGSAAGCPSTLTPMYS
eukprot:scaffold12184_cov114-Isochrysis_galbana.AAC.9